MKKFLALCICLSMLTCLFSCNNIEGGESGNPSSEVEYVNESSAPEPETKSTEESSSQGEAIPYWQMYGEYDDIDFDVTDYLDELGEKYGDNGELSFQLSQSGRKKYEGNMCYNNFDGSIIGFSCTIYIYNNAEDASRWYHYGLKAYHPGICAYESQIRIGNQYFIGFFGFIYDIANYAGIDTTEWVEVRHEISLEKINISCNQEEFIPRLQELGYLIYENNWYKYSDLSVEINFTINSYICVDPRNGFALLICLCDPDKTNFLVLLDSKRLKGDTDENLYLNTCYAFSEKGIVIIGAKPYIDSLVKDIG